MGVINPGGGAGAISWAAAYNPDIISLTVAAPTYASSAATIAIIEQTSDDNFSIITDPNSGLGFVASARGGRFQSFLQIGALNPVLDGGSAQQRWLGIIAFPGPSDPTDPNQLVENIGGTAMMPVLPVADANSADATCQAVNPPSYIKPGGPVVAVYQIALINGFGTDVVNIPADSMNMFCWEM
jgi:hypothetical protein